MLKCTMTLGFCMAMLVFLCLSPSFAFVSTHRRVASFLIRQQQKQTTLSRKQSQSSLFQSSSADTTKMEDLLGGKLEIPLQDAIVAHGEPNVKFVDGTWWLAVPDGNLGQRKTYETGPRILGAAFLDIDDICERDATKNPDNLPHMMPPPQLHASAMDAFNIKNDDHVIVYVQDSKCPFVHRAWYQIGCMGHDWNKVHVLQGSLQDWIQAKGPVDDKPTKAIFASELDSTKPTQYQAKEAQTTVSMQEMQELVQKGMSDMVVDARSEDRFYARVAEPRPGLIPGHMPGSKNVFFLNVLDSKNLTTLKPVQELKSIFENAGVNVPVDKRIITSCGSGATACTLAAAMIACGQSPDQMYIYDGSWAEWGDPKHKNPIISKEDE